MYGQVIVVHGRVSIFNDIYGTGFIIPDIGSGVVKFTYKDIVTNGYRIVCEGQRVQFELRLSAHGPIAVNVTPEEYETGR
jgi:CspA family cold shock protein